MSITDCNNIFGNIDIYLLDQVLKGRFGGKPKLLDAGCGEGRNLKYFVYNSFEVYGNDVNPLAIKMTRMIYKSIPTEHFIESSIEDLDFNVGSFDAIICAAVLHFANDEAHFKIMLQKLSVLLKQDGILFIRMATNVGLNKNAIPDFPFILEKEKIGSTFSAVGLSFIEPWKSVSVEGQRSMGTFILSKN